MSSSLRRLSLGFSSLIVSMIVLVSSASAQVHQKPQPNYLAVEFDTPEAENVIRNATSNHQGHDYYGAASLAMSATDQCYRQKRLDQCDKLVQIQTTLATWCAQNDQDACELL